MRLWTFTIFGLLIALPLQAEGPFPGRYQGFIQPRLVELKEVLGYPEQTHGLGVLSADGQRGLYVTNGGWGDKTDDSYLSLWDVPAAKAIREIKIPGKMVTALALSPDKKQALIGLLASTGKDKYLFELVLCDCDTGKVVHQFAGKKPFVEKVSFATISPDGKRALVVTGEWAVIIAAGTANDDTRLVHLVDLERRVLEGSISLKDSGLLPSQAFSPVLLARNDLALIADASGVSFHDIRKNQRIRTYKLEHGPLIGMALSSDRMQLATVEEIEGADKVVVHLWNLATFESTAITLHDDGILVALALTGKKNQLLTTWDRTAYYRGGPGEGEIVLWDLDNKKPLWRRSISLYPSPLAIVEPGKKAVIGGGAYPFVRWNLDLGVQERLDGGHKAAVNALALDADGSVWSGSQDGHFKVWPALGGPLHFYGHTDAILAMSRVDNFLLTGSADRKARLWDLKTGQIVKTLTGHGGNVNAAVIDPNKEWLATAGSDRLVRTWNPKTGKLIDEIAGHSEGINALAVSPDGQWLASGSNDNTVRLWQTKKGKLVEQDEPIVLEGHKRQVTCLSFTPDGKQLLSGSQDKTIRVWDVARKQSVKILAGHQNWVSSVLVWKDRAISTADDFRIVVWDLAKGTILESIDLTPYADCPRCLALAADGRGFYVGTSGWVILRFETVKK